MPGEQDFWLSLPLGWVPLDPAGGRLPPQLRSVFAARKDEPKRLTNQRRQLRRAVEGLLRNLRQDAVRFAAIFAAPGADGPIVASFTLSCHAVEAGSLPDALDELAQRRGAVTSLLETPFVGPVVRTTYRETITADSFGPHVDARGQAVAGEAPTEIVVWQYLIAPQAGEVLLATGATAALGLSDAFDVIFDAVLGTFQFIDAA